MTSPVGSHSSVTFTDYVWMTSSSTRAAVRFTNGGASQHWLVYATQRRASFSFRSICAAWRQFMSIATIWCIDLHLLATLLVCTQHTCWTQWLILIFVFFHIRRPGLQIHSHEEHGGAGPVPKLRPWVFDAGRRLLEGLVLAARRVRLLRLPPAVGHVRHALPLRGVARRQISSPVGVGPPGSRIHR